MRVGQGFDIHAFCSDPEIRLVLGGVTIEDSPGLQGHSDADVLCHAVIDALLGAAGLGDIGTHFGDDDPRWRGCDSTDLLARSVALVSDAGWQVSNVDCTVIADAPRISTYAPQMRRILGELCGAPVSVKASRAEGLGALGRREGIACLAVVLLEARTRDTSLDSDG